MSQIEVPPRSLLCKHFATEGSPDVFDTAVQTLYTRFFNSMRKIVAATTGQSHLAAPKMCTRDTQTYSFKNAIVQTKREAFTQPQRSTLLNSDKTPGEYTMIGRSDRYETSEKYLRRRDAAIILIQACWRRYKAMCRADSIRVERATVQQQQQELENQTAITREKERQFQLNRRICPRTSEDFQLLYDEVAVWVRQQTFSIKEANLPPEAKQASFELLLEKETRLLQNIDLLKRQAHYLNRSDRVGQFFHRISKPRKWQISDGSFVDVMTPYSLRAASLRDLYYALEESSCFVGPNADTINSCAGYTVTPSSISNYRKTIASKFEGSMIDQRLDVLLQVKWCLKEFDCDLTREAISLIDREADLLSRGRSQTSLGGLRRRLLALFLQFAETPEFNPGTLELISDEADLVYRPNTLPIIDFRSLSPLHREKLARIKMSRQRMKQLSSVDEAREKMQLVGRVPTEPGAADTAYKDLSHVGKYARQDSDTGRSPTCTDRPDGAGDSDSDLFNPNIDRTNLRLVHLNSPLRKKYRGMYVDEDTFCDFPGIGIPLVSEEAFINDGINYVIEYVDTNTDAMKIFDENYYGVGQSPAGEQATVLPSTLAPNQALAEQSTILEGEEGYEENLDHDLINDNGSSDRSGQGPNFEPETVAVIAHHLHGDDPDILGHVIAQSGEEAVTPQDERKDLDESLKVGHVDMDDAPIREIEEQDMESIEDDEDMLLEDIDNEADMNGARGVTNEGFRNVDNLNLVESIESAGHVIDSRVNFEELREHSDPGGSNSDPGVVLSEELPENQEIRPEGHLNEKIDEENRDDDFLEDEME